MVRSPLACLLLIASGIAGAAEPPLPQGQAYQSPDEWRQPVAPVRIADHTWAIGTAGITALLLKTDDGAVLIDGGLPQAATLLLDNLRTLGVAPGDVKLILASHAHGDHAGALATIKRATGAQLLNNAESAVLMANGGGNDIHFGDDILYPPVQTDRILHDGEVVVLGRLRLTPHFIPGHTPGSIAWTWDDTRDGRTQHVAYVDSLTSPGYTLIGNARYPHIVEDFRRSFAIVRALPCDVLLTPHADASGWDFADRRDPHPQPMSCRAYADGAETRFQSKVTETTSP